MIWFVLSSWTKFFWSYWVWLNSICSLSFLISSKSVCFAWFSWWLSSFSNPIRGNSFYLMMLFICIVAALSFCRECCRPHFIYSSIWLGHVSPLKVKVHTFESITVCLSCLLSLSRSIMCPWWLILFSPS